MAKTSKPKSEYKKRKEKYKFELREEIKYVGTVYDQYKNQIGVVKTRLSPRGKIWYNIEFQDGRELMLMEDILEKIEE